MLRSRSFAAVPSVAAGFGSASLLGASAASAVQSLPNGVGAPIKWHECEPRGQHIQCARIRVPLDYDHPAGQTISLALSRHLASKPKQKIGTSFVNPGGPGDSGLNAKRAEEYLGNAVLLTLDGYGHLPF